MEAGGFSEQDCETNTQMFLTRAVSQVNLFHRERLYEAHENLSIIVCCKCIMHVVRHGSRHYYLNCIVRLQSPIMMLVSEKEDLLRSVSRRIFYITSSVKDKIEPWLIRHRYTDFRFVINGLLVKSPRSIKLALSTMRYEVSHSSVPAHVPFMKCQSLLLRSSRWMVMTGLHVLPSKLSVVKTESVFFRSMAKSVCPPEYWPIVSEGLCYMVAVREHVHRYEHWVFHVHTPYERDIRSRCDPSCDNCTKAQPLSLQHIAQLTVLKMLFRARREILLKR